MGRKKERQWEKVGFNLDPEVKKRISELAQLEGISKSHFIELIVARWDEGINPHTKLNALYKKRELRNAELFQVDSEIKKLTSQISAWDMIKREKAKKKPLAINILKRMLQSGEIIEAEKASKIWQIRTGFSSFELIMEAKEQLNSNQHLNPLTKDL